jgi:hypothetical protein
MFDPARKGPFHDPEPKYYNFDQIITFIDKKGSIIAGSLPDKLSQAISLRLFLKSNTKPDTRAIKLTCNPNQRFAFCVPPDLYTIEMIHFIDEKENIDAGVDYPKLMVEIKNNHSNYIGHLFLDPKSSKLLNPIIIPYKIYSRPEQASTASLLGGFIGGAIHLAAMEAKGVIGEHKLFIGYDQSFKPKGKQPLVDSIIHIENEFN